MPTARSPLDTATDAYTMLRIVFSRLGTPSAGSALAYSFNVEGMCPGCECRLRRSLPELQGIGLVSTSDPLSARHLREYVS